MSWARSSFARRLVVATEVEVQERGVVDADSTRAAGRRCAPRSRSPRRSAAVADSVRPASRSTSPRFVSDTAIPFGLPEAFLSSRLSTNISRARSRSPRKWWTPPEGVERGRDPRRVAQLPAERDALGDVRLGRVEVAAAVGVGPEPVEDVARASSSPIASRDREALAQVRTRPACSRPGSWRGARPRRAPCGGTGAGASSPIASAAASRSRPSVWWPRVRQNSASAPVSRSANAPSPARHRPLERLADVVVGRVEPVERLDLAVRRQVHLRLLDEREHLVRVGPAHRDGLAAVARAGRGRPRGRSRASRTRRSPASRRRSDASASWRSPSPTCDARAARARAARRARGPRPPWTARTSPAITATRRWRRSTGSGSSPRLQSIAAREAPLALPGPPGRRTPGPAPSARVRDALRELVEELVRGEDAERRRGELDGQRDAVEAAADRGDRARALAGVDLDVGADGERPLEEQGARPGCAGARRRPARPPSGTASGSTQTTRSRGTPRATRLVARIVEPGRPRLEVGERRRGGADVLHRVEDEQRRTVAERLGERLGQRAAGLVGDAERAGDRGQHHRGVADAVERHERDPARARQPRSRAASSAASRLFPTPPTPTSVRNAGPPSRARSRSSSRSASRPTSEVAGSSGAADGQRGGGASAAAAERGRGGAGATGVAESGVAGSAVGCIEVPSIRREPEPLAARQDPAVGEARDGRRASRAARPRAAASSRSAAVAIEYAPQLGRPTTAAPPSRPARAWTPGGPARRGGRRGRRAPRPRRRTGRRGPCSPRRRSGRGRARPSGPRDARAARAAATGSVLVGDVLDAGERGTAGPRPWRAIAVSNRVAGGAGHVALDEDRDPRPGGTDHADERAAARAIRLARGERPPPRRGAGAILTLATRSPGSTACPSNDREHLERVDPVEPLQRRRGGSSTTPGDRRDEVHPGLGRAADVQPGRRRVAARDGGARRSAGLVLVDLAGSGTRTVTGGPCGASPIAARSPGVSRVPLDSRSTRDREVAGQDRRRRGRRTGVRPGTIRSSRTRWCPRPVPRQPTRASAASSARRVYTTAIAARYSLPGVDVRVDGPSADDRGPRPPR